MLFSVAPAFASATSHATYTPIATNNWCGYIAQGNPGQALQVEGAWTIPTAHPKPGPLKQNESDWIGIGGGGDGADNLIQMGTDMTTTGANPTPTAFIEEFVPGKTPAEDKDYQLPITLSDGSKAVPLTQGAHMVAYLAPDSSTQWHWVLRDYGASGKTQIGISDYFWTPKVPASADSAEVIHEVSLGTTVLPSTGRDLHPFCGVFLGAKHEREVALGFHRNKRHTLW